MIPLQIRFSSALGFAAVLAATTPLAAQDSAAAGTPPRISTAAHRFAVRGTVVALATIATMPFDLTLADAMRGRSVQGSAPLRSTARAFDAAGDPGVLIASALMYGVGRAARAPRLQRIGLHAGEAVVVAGATTTLLKAVAGRQRPFIEAGDADDYTPFRVSGGHTSFPSGHTTVAFAFASAVTAELAAGNSRAAWVAGPLLYGGATLVGMARMYDDKHWASDVVLGAGIGTLAGVESVAFSRAHPHNRVERMLGSVTIAPTAHGAAVAMRFATR